MISAKDEDKIRDRKAYQNVYQSTLIPGFDPGEETVSAHPILSDKAFIARLQRFHEALVRAVANIVERWWEDDASDFPSKMPLEPPVEDVLQVSGSFFPDGRVEKIFPFSLRVLKARVVD